MSRKLAISDAEVGRLYKSIESLALFLIPQTVICCKTKG